MAFADTEQNHVILISIDGLAAYHLENEELELPNLRELIERGAWPEAALSVFPSVTHPAHATLTTGVSPRRHGVIGNRMTNRETGEAFHVTTKTREEAVRARTLFDAAKEKGLTTAAFCWPETRRDPAIDFNILHGHGELDPAEVDPELLEALRVAGVPIDAYYDWRPEGRWLQGHRDTILAKAAAETIRAHRPELVAVHFLVTDSVQHGWGPDHYLSKAALTRADYNLGLVRRAVREGGIEDRTTFVIVSDHGFHSVHHEVNIHPVFAASGLGDRVRLHGSGWTVFVETTEEFDPAEDGAKLESFFDEVLALDGMDRLVRPGEFHELGYPRYEEDPHVAGQYMLVPDIDTFLVARPADESTERGLRARPSHGHGYLPDHPRMQAGMVLSGFRIREGVRPGVVRNHDVAPTIAELLDLDMPDVEGRALRETLEPVVSAMGLPAEGDVAPFLGEPRLEIQELFEGERLPNIVVGTDGTIVSVWGWGTARVRRSEDGGETWGPEIPVGEGLHSGGAVVNERNGDIFVFLEETHPPAPLHVFRSGDQGRTWQEHEVTIHPDENGNVPSMCMNERGITLRHGEHAGRLLRPSRWYGEGNDREYWTQHYTNAIYSDDGGYTWHTSAPFPAMGTGEAAVAELSDGRIYYNSRRHLSTDGLDPRRRYVASSDDGGETWKDLSVSEVLPDGPQNIDYGLMAGLVRLPVAGRDILLFSNVDSPGKPEGDDRRWSERRRGTVWASFDGGRTWPLTRMVYEGPFAYSSLAAGRPGTPSEGWIYLLFEGGPRGAHSDGHVARFNLSWVLEGEATGDGDVPEDFVREN